METYNKELRHAELAVIVPVFNEDRNFPKVYRAIKEHIKTGHRILVVYDFDGDTTVPVVRELAKDDPGLLLIKNTLGRGPANALRMGFDAVRSGPVLVVMADLSDDLGDVNKMVELHNRGFAVVCGSRYMPGGRQIGAPFIKRTLSRLAGMSLYLLRGIPTRDVTNNFKLYDAGFLRSISIESKGGFSIGMEITVKAFLRGEKIAEVPTVWHDRAEGKSNFKLMKWLPQYLKWYFFAFRPRSGDL
jgi:dolichol-phosphate mannosyltransferase